MHDLKEQKPLLHSIENPSFTLSPSMRSESVQFQSNTLIKHSENVEFQSNTLIKHSEKNHSEFRCTSKDSNIQHFRDLALSISPVTDKVTRHSYHVMYGIFLVTFRTKPIKFLEIGLGCNMHYGPGASVQVWKKFLHPESEIWMADYDGQCVQKYADSSPHMMGVKTLVGDQEDLSTLEQWVSITGGKFDVIIDDGGHHNAMMKNSFDVFWPTLNPGGMYFIEDLVCNYQAEYRKLKDGRRMADIIHLWNEALFNEGEDLQLLSQKPSNLYFTFCQSGACAFAKSP